MLCFQMAHSQPIYGRRVQKLTTASSITPINPEAYLCEIVDLDIIVIILRSSVKEVYDDTAVIQYNGQLHKAKIFFRGDVFYSYSPARNVFL